MSRAALLRAVAVRGTPNPKALPDLSDPVAMSLRPNGRSIGTIVIALDGSGDYTTFEAAISAANTMQSAKLSSEGQLYATPNYRVDIIVRPGTYPRQNTGTSMPAPPRFTAFYASDPTRGNTVVMSGFTVGGGTYWEGIDVINTDDSSGVAGSKYGFHIGSTYTNIFQRCAISNQSTTSGGSGWPCGMDGVNGGTCLIYDCTMTGTGGKTNMHGDLSYTVGSPMTMIFVNCSYPGGTIDYHSLIDTQPDQTWMVGNSAGGFYVGGAANTAHFSGDVPATFTHGTSSGPVTATDDARSDWPVPTGGLSAQDRAQFGM